MEIWTGLLFGFQQVLQPVNLLACFAGVVVGTLIGVLPGIGPVGTMSILFPLTLGLPSLTTIIVLAGVYYGAMYGGSTTSILVNIPGEAASVVTCIDGYQMARKGRAGPALGMSALGSFIGGTFSIIALMFLVIPLARVALRIGPPEYFGLVMMGMTMVTYLSGKSFLKGLVMIVIGSLLSCVGTDILLGKERFTYGVFLLYDGIDIVPLAIGLFGISEIFINLEEGMEQRSVFQKTVKNILPTVDDWKKSILPICRGSVLGFFVGLIPGGGAVLASFFSYAVEKQVSKHPEEFGKGAIEGVAGPETANNAAVGGGFIPLFALGIPSNVVMAILLASFVVHGIAPGPGFIARSPDLFWGIICSMYVGNIMLLLLNLPIIGLWIKVLEIPYKILFPLILFFCIIGTFSVNNRIFDMMLMVIFGVVGYIFRKLGYDLIPLILAFVLGPILESSFKQMLVMGGHDFGYIFTRPIAFVALCITLVLIISGSLFKYREKLAEKVKE